MKYNVHYKSEELLSFFFLAQRERDASSLLGYWASNKTSSVSDSVVIVVTKTSHFSLENCSVEGLGGELFDFVNNSVFVWELFLPGRSLGSAVPNLHGVTRLKSDAERDIFIV